MKVTELRIGNWIKTKANIFIQVTGLDGDRYKYILSNGNKLKHHLKTASPIPLTEEWLLKLGGRQNPFQKLPTILFISITNLKAELHFEIHPAYSEIVTTIKSDFSNLILDELKYVHQLQNLYFALTGEELNVTETVVS